jgi:hypothetical protein
MCQRDVLLGHSKTQKVHEQAIDNCSHAIELFLEHDETDEAAVTYAERATVYQQIPLGAKADLAAEDFHTADRLFNDDPTMHGVPFCGTLLEKILVINPL